MFDCTPSLKCLSMKPRLGPDHLSAWLKRNARRIWNQGLREVQNSWHRGVHLCTLERCFQGQWRENNRVARRSERAAESYADLINAKVTREDLNGAFVTISELLDIAEVLTRRGSEGMPEPMVLEEIISEVDRRRAGVRPQHKSIQLVSNWGWGARADNRWEIQGPYRFKAEAPGARGAVVKKGTPITTSHRTGLLQKPISSYGAGEDGEDKFTR